MAIVMLLPTFAIAGGEDEIAAANALSKSPYDYFCTGVDGSRYELGEVVCLVNNSCTQAYLAKCDMSLNSPMWREVQDSCPVSNLLYRFKNLQPLLDSGAIDTQVANTKS